MADSAFVIRVIKHGWPALAARMAVMWPIVKKKVLSDTSARQAIETITRLWRLRLRQLHDANYCQVSTLQRLQYCRNCVPAFAIVENQAGRRTCRLRTICPWCYARKVHNLYKAMESYVGSDDIKFVALTTTLVVYKREVPGQLLLRPLLTYYSRLASKVLKKLEPAGGAYTVVVDPRDDRWIISARLLVLVDPAWSAPDWLTQYQMDVLDSGESTKQALAKTVRKVCRYPIGMLTASTDAVVEVLNAQRNKKLRAIVGCLRKTRRG